VIVTDLRVPRTILGLLVGAALGLAGALMQALTRNPLADPGLLGVNAGAAAAVIVAIALQGLTGITAYVWFALLGAAIASVVVYAIGTGGRGAATPARLALAGTAITAALTAFTYAVALSDADMLQRFNQWNVRLAGRARHREGLEGRAVPRRRDRARAPAHQIAQRAGPRRRHRACARRERRAHAHRRRRGDHAAVGAATAAAGPIVFVGLTIPYVARAIVGTDPLPRVRRTSAV
jgi:iron complex transport system permease protein